MTPPPPLAADAPPSATAAWVGWAGGCAALTVVALGGSTWPLPWRLGTTVLGVLALLASSWQLWQSQRHLAVRRMADAQRLSRLLALAADSPFELDAEGRLCHLGQDTTALADLSGHQWLGLPPWSWSHCRMSEAAQAELRSKLKRGQGWRDLPLLGQPPGGPARHLQLSAEPLLGHDGDLLGFVGVLRDVTATDQTLEALRQSETRFHDLFRRLPTPVVVHRQGRVLDANPAAVALFGYPDLASMLGQDLVQAYEAGDSRQRAIERLAAHSRQPAGQHLPPAEYHLTPTPGQQLIVQASSAVVEAEDGQPALLTIYIDDTEHRRAEQAMQRSEVLLSHLVANSPDLITLTDLSTGRYLMVNPSFVRTIGYSAEEAVGKTSLELGIWASADDREQLVETVRRDGAARNLALNFRLRNGRLVSMLVSAARFELEDRQYLILNCRDVTATEQARLEREALLENAQMGIALTRDYKFLLANPRLEQMLGWPRGSLAGQSVAIVWPAPEDFKQLSTTLVPRLNQGEQVELEQLMQRRDGSTFTCRLLAKAVDPSHPSRGGTIWFAEDISQRRQTERALARARDDAEAANRAKSAFLASTSHEIRTPLNALLGLARLARQPQLDEARRQHYIEQISDSAETLSGILTDILDLSKIEAGKMHIDQVVFDLGALLTALHQAYGALADTKGLGFSMTRDDDLPEAVIGDSMRVRQILSNFLNNALKFTTTGQLQLAARVVRPGLLRFEVTDTGPGISPDTQARLFHPFAQGDTSINRAYGGTGLGLSICRELAELMGGRVGVVSSPGLGSCFWAELPLPHANPEELDSGTTSGGADPIRGARVLMVEDNPVNMMIAVALLEQWGALVSQSTDGAAAITAVDEAHQQGNPFDVVLMDVQMPGVSGHDATRALRRHYDAQTLPIIALTAAALVSERNEALQAGMNDFLTKPIDAVRLRHALVKALRLHTGESP